jgi:hypothetical protein
MDQAHSLATERLPWFVTKPGETDVLLVVTAVLLLVMAIAFGVLLLRLHHLPEHIASKSQKVQYEVVAVLGLLAMFTHQNIFWVIALLLAVIDLPDFGPVFERITDAVERIANWRGRTVGDRTRT